MRPAPKQPAPAVTARWSLLAPPAAVTVGTFIAFVARDGFAVGDLVGALVIGLATLAAFMVIRRAARR